MNDEHQSEIDTTKNLVAEVIGAAEEILDPLDSLVEKTAADPGAAFAPEVLERLAAMKKDDRAAFEALRAQLIRESPVPCLNCDSNLTDQPHENP